MLNMILQVLDLAINHYNDVMMSAMASQLTSLTIVYSTVYSGADQRKHQSSALLAYMWGIHRWPVNSPHKGPLTQKMFPFDDVIMYGYTTHSLIMIALIFIEAPRFSSPSRRFTVSS